MSQPLRLPCQGLCVQVLSKQPVKGPAYVPWLSRFISDSDQWRFQVSNPHLLGVRPTSFQVLKMLLTFSNLSFPSLS